MEQKLPQTACQQEQELPQLLMIGTSCFIMMGLQQTQQGMKITFLNLELRNDDHQKEWFPLAR